MIFGNHHSIKKRDAKCLPVITGLIKIFALIQFATLLAKFIFFPELTLYGVPS